MSKKKMKRLKYKATSPQKNEDEGQFSLLQEMLGTNPFAVPDGYFDRLPADIMEKIFVKTEAKSRVIRTVLDWRWPYKVAVAASVILIAFAITYVVLKPQATQQLISEIQQITASELMEYDGYLVDLDESLVDNWIAQKGDSVESAMLSLASLDELSGDDITEYLLSEYSPDELTIDPE